MYINFSFIWTYFHNTWRPFKSIFGPHNGLNKRKKINDFLGLYQDLMRFIEWYCYICVVYMCLNQNLQWILLKFEIIDVIFCVAPLENQTSLKVEHWHLYHACYAIGFFHQNKIFLYYLQLTDHLHVLELQCWCEDMWGPSPKWMCWLNLSFPHRWHHPLPIFATFVVGMQPL